jgi:hypothetical protein
MWEVLKVSGKKRRGLAADASVDVLLLAASTLVAFGVRDLLMPKVGVGSCTIIRYMPVAPYAAFAGIMCIISAFVPIRLLSWLLIAVAGVAIAVGEWMLLHPIANVEGQPWCTSFQQPFEIVANADENAFGIVVAAVWAMLIRQSVVRLIRRMKESSVTPDPLG